MPVATPVAPGTRTSGPPAAAIEQTSRPVVDPPPSTAPPSPPVRRLPPGHIALVALLAALVAAPVLGVPALLGIPAPAGVALSILLVAATLWISELVPLFVTSFLILALSETWLRQVMAGAGLDAARSLFTAPFFSDVILLFLGGFVLSAALHKYGIDERLARWVLARAGASIPRLMAGIMGITAVLSMWLSNTATTAMMLTLCLPILRSLPANDRSRKGILLAVPFAANVGGIGTPIGTPPNAIAIQYWHEIGSAPSFLRWIVATIPIVAVLLVVTWAVLLAMFRGQAKHVTIETAARASGLSRQAGFIALVAAITVAGWLTGALHGLTSGTVALLPVLLLFGSRLLDVKDLRNLSWDVLLMMGGGLCLGKGIEASGLAEWMVARVPVDGMGPFVLGAIFAVTACFMSTVMSNTASANLLLPIVVGIGATSSGSLLVGVALACSMAMALPISTPPNAIAFSSGELTARDMLRPGLVITIAGLVVVLLIAPHWWRVVGFL